MHVEEIEESLERNDIPAIENAFRALVGWPTEMQIEGADGSLTLMNLLKRVCNTLMHDNLMLPRRTLEVLAHENKTGMNLDVSTYMNGAAFVLQNVEKWWEIFGRSFDSRGNVNG